jgi:hypothetical protein
MGRVLYFLFFFSLILGSIYAQSVAAARAEQALSDVTSSLSSNIPRPGPQRAWHVQLRIWLLTGELYVRLGKGDEAMACVQEASALSPASHHIMFLVWLSALSGHVGLLLPAPSASF